MTLSLAFIVVALTALGQILLKMATRSSGAGIFNPLVIFAYAVFMIVVLLSFYLMKLIPLKAFAAIMSLNYVAVALLAAVVLKERMTRRKLIGTVFVASGAWLFVSGF